MTPGSFWTREALHCRLHAQATLDEVIHPTAVTARLHLRHITTVDAVNSGILTAHQSTREFSSIAAAMLNR